MADFTIITCPQCNNKLQIGKNVGQFACESCGTEFVVDRSGGIISILPLVEGIRKVQTGVDKTAAELALARLRRDIEQLQEDYRGIDKDDNTGLYVGGVIAFFIGGIVVSNDGGGVIGAILIVGGILVVIGGISASMDKNKTKQEISKKIRQKQSESANHEKVVNL